MNNIRNEFGQNLEEFLIDYKQNQLMRYPKPSVTVDTLIFTVKEKLSANYRKLPKKQLYVLLIKRKDHPCINEWALPGGFINLDENLDESALRELKEETNLDELYIEQLYTFGDKDRDPRTRIVSVSYMALIPQNYQGELFAGDDAMDADWFKVDFKLKDQSQSLTEDNENVIIQTYELKLTNECSNAEELVANIKIVNRIKHQNLVREIEIISQNAIAFDHSKIICYGLERLKNKVEYTDIIFSLMPKTFTLSELQQVYELLLDEKLYAAHFRRKIEPKLIRLTDQTTGGKGHRPAQRYVYNPLWQLQKNLGGE